MGTWVVAVLLAPAAGPTPLPAPPAGFPRFAVEEFAADFKIGYAVVTADVNGDKKPDIVVVDQHRVVWYENPTWKPRVILQGKTAPDNVCIAAADLDGGGDVEFVLGARWKPFDTKTAGTLQWLKRGKSLDDEWTLHPIPCDEPTVHRVRIVELPDRKELILAPLMGRDSTKAKNWADGRPVRILAYPVPKTPTDPKAWVPKVVCEDLRVVHNFDVIVAGNSYGLATASYDGVCLLMPNGGGWKTRLFHPGDQRTPDGSRGASELKRAEFPKAGAVVATVEPWHGNSFVVYTRSGAGPRATNRIVVDTELRWGHAVSFADLDGDGTPELIGGVRDDPAKGDDFTARRGVRIYRTADGAGATWDRYLLEDGGVAVEDLCVTDLDGDGKPDIIAVGRATGNGRIYWNKGK